MAPDSGSYPPLRSAPERGLGRLPIGEDESRLVNEVLASKQLFRFGHSGPDSEGCMTGSLEKEFCEFLDVEHALAVTSGTAALETALGALGVGPGDEVIVPAWSWASCFTAIVRLGARPILAEIDESLCLAPGEITRLATARTKAAIVVHFQGVAAALEPILQEAQTHTISVIEDCAESPGAMYRGKRVGSMGALGIFSFQNQKTMTSGEGGMVVTNDTRLYERAIRMHDLGQVRAYFKNTFQSKEQHFCGSQFRMSELTAAVALAQFRRLDSIRGHCQKITARLLERAGSLPLLQRRSIPDPQGDSAFETYFFAPNREIAAKFHASLNERQVMTTPLTGTYAHYSREYCQLGLAHHPSASPFQNLGQMPVEGYRPQDFPRTEDLVWRMIPLPVGVAYTLEDADYIADTLKAVYRQIFS